MKTSESIHGPSPAIYTLLVVLMLATFSFFFEGCNSVAVGSDPVVVRAEQAESGATNTLNLIVTLDDANRGFWMTNAPALHTFAESLRKPVQIDGVTLPAGLAAVRSVDDVRVAYVAGKATSNDLAMAVSVLQSLLSQASAWSTIVSNTPNP